MLKRLCFVTIERHGLDIELLPSELREEYTRSTTASVLQVVKICSPWSVRGEMLLLVAYYFGRSVEFRRTIRFTMQRHRCDDALETVERLSGCNRLVVIPEDGDIETAIDRFERGEILTVLHLTFRPDYIRRILAVPGAVYVWPAESPLAYLGRSVVGGRVLSIAFKSGIDVLPLFSAQRLLQILFDIDIRKAVADDLAAPRQRVSQILSKHQLPARPRAL